MTSDRNKPKEIKTISDLEEHIYWEFGTIEMEDVRQLLDLIKKHKHLLKDHV